MYLNMWAEDISIQFYDELVKSTFVIPLERRNTC